MSNEFLNERDCHLFLAFQSPGVYSRSFELLIIETYFNNYCSELEGQQKWEQKREKRETAVSPSSTILRLYFALQSRKQF